ncbi:TM2 domain-containing protein [Vagococcus hydrophili]|uniref:TM2 domain-containing protein n=1 Tax=Vagococcus hydrophili TaxID=2714947 RepID=A0A6G8ATG5_9ENTE|nr:TM2 domain-containing protein [Vagococcus hydrophili]QIL48354.1 TM2 domain-containing protein [Vagococcus hydrophili]
MNKVVYILLAIFLGDLGGHKFYCGKTGSGIVYLLFCWTFIPDFVGFIEGIVAIAKPVDANGDMVI